MGVTIPAPDHAAHDALLLAALASGDELAPAEAARAEVLIRDCPECRTLLADLRGIRAATAALVPPRRRRDFRLTDADAARMHPHGWRGLVAAFGSARAAFTRPLAAGLVTIGIAGLFVAATPGLFSFGATATLSTVGSSVQLSSAERAPVMAPSPAPEASSAASQGAGAGGAAQAPVQPQASAAPAASAVPSTVAAPAMSAGADKVMVPGASATPGSSAALRRSAVPAETAGTFGAMQIAPPQPSASAGGPVPAAGSAAPGTPSGQRTIGEPSQAPKIAAESPGGSPAAPESAQAALGGASSTGGTGPGGGFPWLPVGSAALVAAGVALLLLRVAGRRILGA